MPPAPQPMLFSNLTKTWYGPPGGYHFSAKL
jgi:hypothetical protein